MIVSKLLRFGAVAALASVCLAAPMRNARSAAAADVTPPVISYYLVQDGQTVTPDASGMVYIGAKASDTGGIRTMTLSVPHAYGTATPMQYAPWAMVRAGWDTNDDAPGWYTATCVATDLAGNRNSKSISVYLAK